MDTVFRKTAIVVALCLLAAAAAGEESQRFTDDCSSVALDNRGQAILGGNLDWIDDVDGMLFVLKRGVAKVGLSAGTTGEVARWTSQYASLAFSLVGVQHAWAGMNERGLVFSTMGLRSTRNPPPDERPPLTMMWPQYMLDTCETVEDVIASDDVVRIWTVDHFLFADRFGGVAVVEFLDGEMVSHSGPELCARALTNTTYSHACSIWENMRSSGDCSSYDNSIERFCRAANLLVEFEGGSTAHAVNFAFDTLREMYPPEIRWHTRWTIVFDTVNLRAYFKTRREPEVRWVDLEAFDLRCGAPVMMLGIDDVASGNATGGFTEYDSERNREFRRAYYEQWDLGWDTVAENQLLRHVESFPCTQSWRVGGRRVLPSIRVDRRPSKR